MLTVATRVSRCALAFMLVALGACADEPTTTSSTPRNLEPHFAVDNVVLVTNTSGGTEVGSLRWAASFATAVYPLTIRFDPSLAGDTITLQAGLDVPGEVFIEGPADKGITISGAGQFRVLRGRGIYVNNVTITGGNADAGSAIWAEAVRVQNSTVRDNGGGGAAIHAGTVLNIVNSTVSRNTGYYVASGIEYGYNTLVTISNSTVARNGPGPGMARSGFPNGTPNTVTVRNSIIAGNGSPAKNCRETVALQFQGMNVVNDNSCGTGAAIKVVEPYLHELADNGGPTPTAAPAQFSPVINAGLNCDVTVDQRYVPRDAKCDIGAVEFNDFNVVTITIEPNATIDASGTVMIKGTAKCSRPYDNFGLWVQVNQAQKVGKNGMVVVRGTGEYWLDCTTSAKAWFAIVEPWSGGTFKGGTASVSVSTTDTPVWVAPAYVDQAVKFARPKP